MGRLEGAELGHRDLEVGQDLEEKGLELGIGAVDLVDFAGGLVKALLYGGLVAIAGCLRGMECGNSAAAVGLATTSSVVTSIVLIVVSCGIMTVIYTNLGI